MDDIKKYLKKMNTINQLAKHIFTKYYCFDNKYIIGDNISSKGIHYMINPIFDFSLKEHIYLKPIDIYTEIKNNKKNIVDIRIDSSNNIIFTNNYDYTYIIGGALDNFPEDICNKYEDIKLIHNTLKNSKDIIQLSDDEVKTLYSNKLLTLSTNKFFTRLTKEVIPGLRKSDKITIYFFNKNEETKIFNIGIERLSTDNLLSYSIFYALGK